jgi:hypothetical protein
MQTDVAHLLRSQRVQLVSWTTPVILVTPNVSRLITVADTVVLDDSPDLLGTSVTTAHSLKDGTGTLVDSPIACGTAPRSGSTIQHGALTQYD